MLPLAVASLLVVACSGQKHEGIQVIGAGFGRTGTSSLYMALRELGYRVYHGSSFYQRFEDWPLFKAALDEPEPTADGHAAGDGEASSNAHTYLWNHLLSKKFDTFLDEPASILWRSQLQHSPDAKVILSVRDPRTWAESMLMVRNNKFSPVHGWWKRMPFMWLAPFSYLRRIMTTVHEDSCGQFPCGPEGDAHQINRSIALFQKRTADVQEHVAAQQLLIWDPSDGWAPLCKFLDPTKQCPTKPFPAINPRDAWRKKTDEQGKAANSWKVWAFEYLWFPAAALVVIVCGLAIRKFVAVLKKSRQRSKSAKAAKQTSKQVAAPDDGAKRSGWLRRVLTRWEVWMSPTAAADGGKKSN